MQTSIVDLMWQALQSDLQRVRDEADVARSRTERAETAGGVTTCAYGALPYAASGAAAGDVVFCTNARKVGEGAGAGTGTLCYFNSTDDTWRRVGDDTTASI